MTKFHFYHSFRGFFRSAPKLSKPEWDNSPRTTGEYWFDLQNELLFFVNLYLRVV